MIYLIFFCGERYTTNDEYFIKVTGASISFDTEKIVKIAQDGVDQMEMGAETLDNKIRKLFFL